MPRKSESKKKMVMKALKMNAIKRSRMKATEDKDSHCSTHSKRILEDSVQVFTDSEIQGKNPIFAQESLDHLTAETPSEPDQSPKALLKSETQGKVPITVDHLILTIESEFRKKYVEPMNAAAQKEREMAIAGCRVDEEDMQIIDVIVDGSWCKR